MTSDRVTRQRLLCSLPATHALRLFRLCRSLFFFVQFPHPFIHEVPRTPGWRVFGTRGFFLSSGIVLVFIPRDLLSQLFRLAISGGLIIFSHDFSSAIVSNPQSKTASSVRLRPWPS